ncbi:MAG: hemolysin XhlA family protein [Bacteroidia bacterium]|nr:hemolysin XhlA family protein [Bacteroidia bacterium]
MRGLLGISLLLWAQQPPENTVVPFTLSDKERLIRLESQLQNLQKDIQSTNTRIDRMENYIAKIENRIDRLENRLDTYFFTLISLIIALIGFILWDRKKTLQPLEQKIAEIQKDTSRLTGLLQALHEYAKNHPDLAMLLRQYGAL